MPKSQYQLRKKIKLLPNTPGVYLYYDKAGNILYIGKATSLKNRVGSYFVGAHNARTEQMVSQVDKLEIKKTDTVLEALILEANLIKKHQPKYNVQQKDDKSFSYFAITKEDFPRVLILRKTDLENYSDFHARHPELVSGSKYGILKQVQDDKRKIQNFVYGPYTSKKQMIIALDIIRKIFPFHSLRQKTEKGCLDFEIGKCPGPYADKITKQDYAKNIRGIKMILEGKKASLIRKMEREMNSYSKNREFEKAGQLRNKIFALRHIQDIALISSDDEKFKIQNSKLEITRIEAYDISNISGQFAVGSMVVFAGKEPNKSEYRKFKIKTVEGINDVAMMREILSRRFNNDWPKPNLILLDGGKGHLNMAKDLFVDLGIKIPTVAVAKGPTRKNLELHALFYDKKEETLEILKDLNFIGRVMDEAHRFAIGYHKKLRSKNL